MANPPFLVYTHILMGTIGLLSGAVALFLRKGSLRHRQVGNVFFGSMLIMAGLGAYGALFVPEMISALMGVFTCYLVATAWVTVRRKEGESGKFEIIAFLIIVVNVFAFFYFGIEAKNSETGLKDGFPPEPHFIFGAIAMVAALLDLNVIRSGGLWGKQRIARHAWRMTLALIFASASLFLGQPQVFPEAIRDPLILSMPVLILLVVMLFWIIRVLFTKWYEKSWA